MSSLGAVAGCAASLLRWRCLLELVFSYDYSDSLLLGCLADFNRVFVWRFFRTSLALLPLPLIVLNDVAEHAHLLVNGHVAHYVPHIARPHLLQDLRWHGQILFLRGIRGRLGIRCARFPG